MTQVSASFEHAEALVGEFAVEALLGLDRTNPGRITLGIRCRG